MDIDEFDNSVDFLLESGILPSTNMDLYDEFNILQDHDFTNLENIRTYFENALREHESQMTDDDYGNDDVYESLRIVVDGLRNPEQVFPIDLENIRARLHAKMTHLPMRKMKTFMGKPPRVGGRKTGKREKKTKKQIKKQKKNHKSIKKQHKRKNKTHTYRK